MLLAKVAGNISAGCGWRAIDNGKRGCGGNGRAKGRERHDGPREFGQMKTATHDANRGRQPDRIGVPGPARAYRRALRLSCRAAKNGSTNEKTA